jgi:hypothetical protein
MDDTTFLHQYERHFSNNLKIPKIHRFGTATRRHGGSMPDLKSIQVSTQVDSRYLTSWSDYNFIFEIIEIRKMAFIPMYYPAINIRAPG